eukprot:Phypoly_transcript_09295.p1 GENE.Phypoly_transcript_09295~~Phypoly_transcript_09295.p1  ORF type:complete len:395 (+),score=59.00 Phypoly_transcript_09295:203-1387(+)
MASSSYVRWFVVCIILQTFLFYVLFRDIPFLRNNAVQSDEKDFYDKLIDVLSQNINSTQQQNKFELQAIQQGFLEVAKSVSANIQNLTQPKKSEPSDIKDTHPELMKYRYALADAPSNPGEVFTTTMAFEMSLCQESGSRFWAMKTEMLGWVFDDSGFTGEWTVREVFKKVLARSPAEGSPNLVLDVGSNSGLFSMIAAIYNTKRIYAFDPQPLCAQYVTLASKLNGFHNRLAVINAFVGVNESLVTPIPVDTCRGTFQVGGEGTKMVDIHSVSLDNHFLNDPDEIDLMKVDVEGAEIFILQGAEELFKKHRVRTLVIEITAGWWGGFGIDYETGAAFVKRILVDTGYKVWVMFNNTSAPKKLDGWPALDQEMRPPPGYHNQKNFVFSLDDLYS